MKILFLLLFSSIALIAQPTGNRIIYVTAAPSGTCGPPNSRPLQYVISGANVGKLYSCDTTWKLLATAGGGSTGTVTTVGFTGGLISVANPTTTPAFTVAGILGGIPYFSSTSAWASSALLVLSQGIVGGGAGAAPASGGYYSAAGAGYLCNAVIASASLCFSYDSAPNIHGSSALSIGWTPNVDVSGAMDTVLKRGGVGVVDISGAFGSDCSTASNCRDLRIRTLIGRSSAPSVATCGTIGTGSTNAAGFITTATGACTPVVTFSGTTAPTGWACAVNNKTTPANIFQQTNYTTTTATFTGVSGSDDVLIYNCIAF